jgi:hypothetical protein
MFKLEYGSILVTPQLEQDMVVSENTQGHATKFCTQSQLQAHTLREYEQLKYQPLCAGTKQAMLIMQIS